MFIVETKKRSTKNFETFPSFKALLISQLGFDNVYILLNSIFLLYKL